MKLQKDMEESFVLAHRDFMNNLEKSFEIIDHDLKEAAEVDSVCTGEWCQAVETSLDELAKFVFSISEPRWLDNEDSQKLSSMRHRLHDLYAKYKGINTRSTH